MFVTTTALDFVNIFAGTDAKERMARLLIKSVHLEYETEILNLAGYMFHEYWHRWHQGVMWKWRKDDYELVAWGKQRDLLRKFYKTHPLHRSGLRDSIDHAQDMIYEYWGN